MFNNFFNNKFKVNNFTIGSNKVYVIAEAGSNHNGDINLAINLINEAKNCGANAIKFQLFRADYLESRNSKNYKLLKKIEFNRTWLPKIIKHCKKRKIDFVGSPFDTNAFDLLYKYKVGAIKIASSEVFNLRLVNYFSKKQIPLFVSTGISNYIDIFECLNVIMKNNNKNVALLQCTSVYPAKETQINLRVIDSYKKIFNFPVGYSDHSLGILSAEAATAKGAKIIEKHFTLDKSLAGPDHKISVEPKELKKMIESIRLIEKMQGYEDKYPLKEELELCRKNGLYLRTDLKKNQIIKIKHIKIKNPQIGIEARYLKLIDGLKIKKNILKNKPLLWKDIK